MQKIEWWGSERAFRAVCPPRCSPCFESRPYLVPSRWLSKMGAIRNPGMNLLVHVGPVRDNNTPNCFYILPPDSNPETHLLHLLDIYEILCFTKIVLVYFIPPKGATIFNDNRYRFSFNFPHSIDLHRVRHIPHSRFWSPLVLGVWNLLCSLTSFEILIDALGVIQRYTFVHITTRLSRIYTYVSPVRYERNGYAGLKCQGQIGCVAYGRRRIQT